MSMDIENKEKADKLAQEILRLSRNTLLVNLRFLDMALSRLKHSPAGDSLAVNGIRIFYDPMWVLRRYKGERNAIGEDAFEDCDNITIYASKDSFAYEYAKKVIIPFEFV